MKFTVRDDQIFFRRQGEEGCLSACGENGIRFRAAPSGQPADRNWTLMPRQAQAAAWVEEGRAVLETGEMRAEIYENGKTIYYRAGRKILEELSELTFDSRFRRYRNLGSDLWQIRVMFRARPEEHFYGLGQEPTDCFDLKGCSVDLRHVNTKCTIPFVYSSLGYGFLWNQPSTGQCELGCNRTCWTSDAARQMDYVVMGGEPRQVARTLADLTGHAPRIPDWALGFWQCRLRYETQDQLLAVARRYKELGIPLDVIVVDYFHWTEQGDYRFDPRYWPDPKAMADELHSMGVKLMVSMWPTINEKSENYREMLENNMLVASVSGSNRVMEFYGPQAVIDPTNPETRDYVWRRLKENYLDAGVDCLWFDEAEPGIRPEHFDNLIFSIGNGSEVALLFPYYYNQLVYDGMKAMGREDILTLSRSAYLGAQKFGALVWSGDVPSTFESLRMQVKAGLNMAMCGIPWWTTDIGGFYGGDTETEYFRELIVRWFQFGLFCPVMRLHGSREGRDNTRNIPEPTGGDNEIWSFGERDYPILRDLIFLRQRLRPYLRRQMDQASETGVPVMRPMFFDYPDDPVCYTLGEQYLFGDDILFAPIVGQGQTTHRVYLPQGDWAFTRDGRLYKGGAWYEMTARLDEFIAFVKKDAPVLEVFLEK